MLVKIKILSALFILLFLTVAARLFYWQVVQGSSLAGQAKNQYSSSKVTTAPRGNILASDGSFWTVRTPAWDIWANPRILTIDPQEVAEKISPLLIGERENFNEAVKEEVTKLTPLLKKNTAWIILKRRIDDDTKKNIEALGIKGIGFDQTEASYYPEASSAAQVLGFVGKDNNGEDLGYFGLEGYYNLPLSGKSGYIGGEKDAKGSPILIGGIPEVLAVAGVDLQTSLDKRIQTIVERELFKGIEKYGASGGSVTVMDPKTGKILAMSSLPSFDPLNYASYNDSLFKNPVITNAFEPGSIFKVVVMAAGLDAGVVRPDTKCDICDKALKLDKYYIKTWNDKYSPDISMTDTIIESDNVGMSFVGLKLGADAMYDYLMKFGFGQKTGIDLQGEAVPRLREKGNWSVVDLATASFGQGVAVTGIQMIRAVSAIANGGYLVTPKIVDSVKGDGWERKIDPVEPARIISQKTATEVTQMMVEAASRGESKWTKLRGYTVAGKTGTAQIPVAGHYDELNTNHSFIGFSPQENPKFIMLVTLMSPQSSPWAAETAAPLWYDTAKDIFPYLGISPKD